MQAVLLLALIGAPGDRGEEIMAMNASNTVRAGKRLVVYYSWSGNTREVARQIQKATGADLFEIVPARPYPDGYRAVVEQAKKEIKAGVHPELKTNLASPAEYDVIFVGSPNWWSTLAPPVATFLASHDLAGKTVVPFMTHGGGGLGHSVRDIQLLCPGAVVLKGLSVYGEEAGGSQKEVEDRICEILPPGGRNDEPVVGAAGHR